MFSSTEDVRLREEMCLAGSHVGYMKNEFVLWLCVPLGTLIQGSASYFINSDMESVSSPKMFYF